MPTARCPKRAPRSPPGKAVRPASSGPGAIMNPARSTDSCQRPVSSRTPPSTSAPKPPKKASELRSASATARWRMTAGSMMGLGCRQGAQHQPGARHERPARRRRGSVRWSSPSPSPRRWPATRLATATVRRAAPSRSDLCASGSRTSSSVRTPRTRATRAKGRLTRKTQRQLAWTSRPPIGGPRAAAAPPTADHRPMAAPLRSGPNAGRSRPSEVGQHEGAADRLQDPGADQEAEGRGDGAEGGRGGEDGQPEEEGPLAPGPVGPAAGRDQGGGEHDRVGAQHPRERAQALAVVAGRDAGKAMLTMNRSSEERNTPVRTIRAVRTGRAAVPRRSGISSKFCHATHSTKRVL